MTPRAEVLALQKSHPSSCSAAHCFPDLYWWLFSDCKCTCCEALGLEKRLCSQQGIYSLCWRHTGFGMWLWRWQRTSHTLKSQYLTISIFDLVVNAQHTGEGAVNKLRYWNEFGVPVTINKWTPNSTAGWCGLLDWILLSTLGLGGGPIVAAAQSDGEFGFWRAEHLTDITFIMNALLNCSCWVVNWHRPHVGWQTPSSQPYTCSSEKNRASKNYPPAHFILLPTSYENTVFACF